MSNYVDIFQSWRDVQSQYDMQEHEPDEVIYAQYSYECYSGHSNVVYRNGDRFYWVRGSHCSCYGLEGQWNPEEYSANQFIEAYNRGNWWESDEWPSSVIDRVREFAGDNYNGA